jgi:hypothetical protein
LWRRRAAFLTQNIGQKRAISVRFREKTPQFLQESRRFHRDSTAGLHLAPMRNTAARLKRRSGGSRRKRHQIRVQAATAPRRAQKKFQGILYLTNP